MAITFHNADIKFSLSHKKELKTFLARQVGKEDKQIKNISYVFCSDEYLLNINKQFLNHDFYTDIITFPLSDDKKHIESEIYISIERVRENAMRFAIEGLQKAPKIESLFHQEIHRVIFHGVLHLLGYKDKTKSQREDMRKKEDLWLKKYDKYLKSSKL